jgi:hypothetical protein
MHVATKRRKLHSPDGTRRDRVPPFPQRNRWLVPFDDAVAAAGALREISAGHLEAAEAILSAAGLEDLADVDLEALCARFGVEVE